MGREGRGREKDWIRACKLDISLDSVIYKLFDLETSEQTSLLFRTSKTAEGCVCLCEKFGIFAEGK